ncbi:minor tail protein [Microbacterium phage Neferthena]|uniref:Minor tail protein n=1 Tax=Microbacterium phage Neferthena TaxID=2301539 RepID=A0A385D3J9_9CAUD|nr:minor tail protein [Microbacterium phage Neferthena]AXQ52885.1 minor tail protein [Microbacterium phage Neferthena]
MSVQTIGDMTSFKWATVTSASPLAIKLDGDTDPLAMVPDSLIPALLLAAGDRVRVELTMRKVVIHGKANGAGYMRSALLPKSYLYRNAVGTTQLIFDGVLSTASYRWAVPYVPNGARTVTVQWDGDTWVIMGQTYEIKDLSSIAGEYPLTLGPNWWPYDASGNSNDWNDGRCVVLPSGITSISGLLARNGTPVDNEVIASFPAAVAPDYPVIYYVNNQDNARSVTINPDGTVRVRGSWGANTFVSLDEIKFPAKNVAQWTTVGQGGSSWGANFEDYNWNGNPCRFWKDPYGFVWFTGLTRVKVATVADNTRIINLPASCVLPSTKGEQHFRTTGGETYGGLGSTYVAGQGTLNYKPNTNGAVGQWISLTPVLYATADAYTLNNWYFFPYLSNSWVPNGAGQPSPSVTRREDGLICWVGLAALGGYGVRMATAPADCIGRETRLLDAMSNNARGRVDMFGYDRWGNSAGPPGVVYMNQGTTSSWFSLDGFGYAP